MHNHGFINLRFNVVLFPLSLCPSSSTLMVFRLRFRLSDSRNILSMLSLRFLASCSALSLSSRSTWVSLGGGCSATANGSDEERRLGADCCAALFMMEHYRESTEEYKVYKEIVSPRHGRSQWTLLFKKMRVSCGNSIRTDETKPGTPSEKLDTGEKRCPVR